jgi:protein-tyrosine kinase
MPKDPTPEDDRPTMRYGGAAAERSDKHRVAITAGVPLSKFNCPKLLPLPELAVRSAPSSETSRRFTQVCRWLEARSTRCSPMLVTSAHAGEGKSVVAANLALAWAKLVSAPVLLIDADLRHPAVAGWLQPSPRIGLTELLRGQTELAHVLTEVEGSDLRMLTAGQSPRDPTELLAAREFEQLITILSDSFGRVVIDTPPVVPYPDADLVGRFCAGAVIVARAGMTREAPLRQALTLLGSTPILGTLLNDLPLNASR